MRPPSDHRAVAAPVDQRLKVATPMPPTDWPPEGRDPLRRAEPIAADHLVRSAPPQRRGDRAAPAAGAGEDGGPGGPRHPPPGPLAVRAPRCLVEVHRLGLRDRGGPFVGGGFPRGGRGRFPLGDPPGGDRPADQVADQVRDLLLAERL
jgi:hypothetical protein